MKANNLKKWIFTNKFRIIMILLGAISGFSYWYFIGCTTGSCPITSSPYISIIWGATIGYLLSPTNIYHNKKYYSEDNNYTK